MTPEAGLFLEKARRCLGHARAILQIELGDEAGRVACLAAFHAAQALIQERRVVKQRRTRVFEANSCD